MNTEQDTRSFMFFAVIYDALKDLPPEMRNEAAWGVINYGINGVIPDNTNAVARSIVTAFSKLLDNYKRIRQIRIEAGKKGGAPKGNQNAVKDNQNQAKTTKKQPKNNQKQPNNNNNNNKTIISSIEDLSSISSIIAKKQPVVFSSSSSSSKSYSDELKNDSFWCETAQMQLHVNHEQLINYLNEFDAHIVLNEQTSRDRKDFKQHFMNWVRIRMNNQNKQKNGTNRTDTIDMREVGVSTNPEDYRGWEN